QNQQSRNGTKHRVPSKLALPARRLQCVPARRILLASLPTRELAGAEARDDNKCTPPRAKVCRATLYFEQPDREICGTFGNKAPQASVCGIKRQRVGGGAWGRGVRRLRRRFRACGATRGRSLATTAKPRT